MKSSILQAIVSSSLVFLSLLFAGCGGGGGSSPSAATVSGSVSAGPTANSSVTVKTSAGAVVAGPVVSAGNGSFSVAIPTSALASDLVFEATGGTFPDEATSASGIPFGMLSAFVPAGSLAAGSSVTIDPASTIVHKLVAGGMSKATADSSFNSAFGFVPTTSVVPAFANASTASTDTQRLCGIRIAAFSQLTKDLGLAPARQFDLIQALASDLTDGTLDGKVNGVLLPSITGIPIPEDVANRYALALMTFLNSSLNKSKLTIDKLGNLAFNKMALTASYKIEYIPGALAASQGKTSFKLKISNRGDGTPASGLAVALMPKMYMAGMSHSAPVDTVVDNGDGTYSCTVYYLMASGPGMGVWELKVAIGGMGGESSCFYPPVAMSMGSTTRANLKGVNDKITGMMGMPTGRTYYLFNAGLTGMGPSTFNLFLAALDDTMMMSFPAVSAGTILHDQAGTAWSVSSIVVEASTDAATWVTASDNGGGHWSAAGLAGMGTVGTIYVRVSVNGEQKTSNGLVVSGTNGYASFTIVPGM